MKDILRRSSRMGFAVALTLVATSAFAAPGVTPINGYDDSDPTPGDVVTLAPDTTVGSSLWAQKQLKASTHDTVFSYAFDNVTLTTTVAGQGKYTKIANGAGTFGDSNFTGTAAGWTAPNFNGISGTNSGAVVTNVLNLNGTPQTNGQPLPGHSNYLFLSPAGTGTDTVTLTFGSKNAKTVGFFLAGVGNQSGQITVTTDTGDTFLLKGSHDPNPGSNNTHVGNNAGYAYYGFTSTKGFKTLTFSDASHTDKFSITGIDYTLVPEPGAIVSFAAGALLLGGLMLRKRSRGTGSEVLPATAIG
jgi:hypothetical protein